MWTAYDTRCGVLLYTCYNLPMCGRYSIPDPGDIPIRFKGTRIGYDVKPRFNAVPSEELPVVVNTGENHIELMRWGLVPFWAKDTSIGYKMINARAETLPVKPSFRNALALQRCIVPVGGSLNGNR